MADKDERRRHTSSCSGMFLATELGDIGQVIEDNVLALLDTNGVKNSDDIEDDKISYIEAVHALCIAGRQRKAPTRRVHEAVFKILEANETMELTMASYALLVEIAQQYPHITVERETLNGRMKEFMIHNKIWTPFHEEFDVEERARGRRQANSIQIYSNKVVILLQEIREKLERDPQIFHKSEENIKENQKVTGMLMKFKYLYHVLDHDFKCRFQVYRNSKEDEIMHGCYLVQLFKEERRKNLIVLILDLIALIGDHVNCARDFHDLEQLSLCIQELMEMRLSLELERTSIENATHKRGRLGVPRQPIFDLIKENVCIYDKLNALLQAMKHSDLKLRIIFHVFISSIPKPLLKDKIKDPANMTVHDMLNCLKDISSARKVSNVFSSERLKALITNAFKVSFEHNCMNEVSKDTVELCQLLKTAFANLQSIRKNDFHEVDLAVKQALITAEAMVHFAK